MNILAKEELNYIDLSSFKMPADFRGRSVFVVQLWWLVQDWLIRLSPQFMYGWRRFLWRLFGAQVGKNVLLRSTARVNFPWKVKIGDYAWIGDFVELNIAGSIEIGANTVISQYCYLTAGTHDYTKSDFPPIASPIKIEDQVWITTGCFIAPGVTIGRGAIIGARSVVLNDMPPAMICAGSPAKPIKPRPIPSTDGSATST